MAAPQASSSRLEILQARFQQKQLQEKEQKLLQLYDQQQQRAHQVAQRGSAGSNTSNQGSTMNHQTVTRTTTTRTTSTSQGGKVRQMFDERRQTTVKGIDRSYPLEPLDNKPKKQTSNGFTPAKNRNFSKQTITTVKRTARADVNSNLNEGKPVVSYHEEFNRETFGDDIPDDEFVNENEVGRYFNGNSQNRNELLNDAEEGNRKIHMLDYDKNFKHRAVNDLESEQFPEDLMVDVPDKVGKKPITKRLSQAELRLERFKNANSTSKKNIGTRNTNTSVTRKRSDPLFPTQTTRDSTKNRNQENSRTPKKIPEDNKNCLNSEKEDSEFPENRENFCQKTEIFVNQDQNLSELKSTFLIREIIQESGFKNFNSEEDGLRIEEIEDEVVPFEGEKCVNVKIESEEKREREEEKKEDSQEKNEPEETIDGKEEIKIENKSEKNSNAKSVEKTMTNRKSSTTGKLINPQNPELKNAPESQKRKISVKSERRKESIKAKQAPKIEDNIFIDDNCFRNRDRRKIKDSIREKLDLDLRDVIRNKFILPVKKPQKKKSQDETKNVKLVEIEGKLILDLTSDSDNLSRGSSPEKMFERPSEYQEILIEDQTIDPERKNTPSPPIRIKSRRQSVENSETISSAAKRKPSLENRKLSVKIKIPENQNLKENLNNSETINNTEQINNVKNINYTENLRKAENLEMEDMNYKSEMELKIKVPILLDLKKPLKSTKLVKEANRGKKNSLDDEIEEIFAENPEHKIVKKHEAIFDISSGNESEKNKEIETKMLEVEEKRREVEDKMRVIEAREREFEEKMKQVEEKRREFEVRKTEVESKKKEVEFKMKEIENQLVQIREENVKKEKDLSRVKQEKKNTKKCEEVQKSEILSKPKKMSKSPNVKNSCISEPGIDKKEKTTFKVSKAISLEKCRKKSGETVKKNNLSKTEEKFNKQKKGIPDPKILKNLPDLKVDKEEIKSLEKNDVIGFERTDSVESALRRFDSIGADQGINSSKESIRNKSRESTKSRSEKSPREDRGRKKEEKRKIEEKNGKKEEKEEKRRTKEEKSFKNLQIRKTSTKELKMSTPQKPIPAPRNQRKSRRNSEDGKNFDYSRISAARDSIELARNFIRTRSPSCKRKLFQETDSEAKKSKKLTLKDREEKSENLDFDETEKIDEKNQEFLVEKVQEKREDILSEEANEKGKETFLEKESEFFENREEKGHFEISVKREVRRETKSQSSNSEDNRVFVSENSVKEEKSENLIICRNARSPSPDFEERKQVESSKVTRRNVPSSPSKSPDSGFRRGSGDLRNTDQKVTRRPVLHSPKKEISNFSKDEVDAPNFENSQNLLEANQNGSSGSQKQSEIFVVDFNDSGNRKEAKKTILKNEKPQKQNSPSNPVPRPSSSLSASSGGSVKEKMNTSQKHRSAASKGATPRSSVSTNSRPDCSDSMASCKICSRYFTSDRIDLHEKICSKSGQKKRKQFDAMKFRLQGTDLEPYAKTGIKNQESKQKKTTNKSNWRKAHEEFINAIRSAKQVQAHLAAGGKLSDLPPPPPSDNSDYIQCPHCGRKFNQGAAERHIPKCENMRHNKPNPRAPPRPRR